MTDFKFAIEFVRKETQHVCNDLFKSYSTFAIGSFLVYSQFKPKPEYP